MKNKNIGKIRKYFPTAFLVSMPVVSLFLFSQARAQPVESTGTCTFLGCQDCFHYTFPGPFLDEGIPFKEVLIEPNQILTTPCSGDGLDGLFEFSDQRGVVNLRSGVGSFVESGTFSGDIGEERDVTVPARCSGQTDDFFLSASLRCVIEGSQSGPLGILTIPIVDLTTPGTEEYTLKIISN